MPTASRGRQKGGLVAAPTVRGAGRLGLLARHVAATTPAAAAVPSDAPPPPPDVGLDADVFLANRLTALEREQFARDGFFVLEDAIPEAHSAQMRDVLTQIREEKVAAGTLGANEQAKQGAFSQANTLQTQEPVLALLSNEKVFAKVVDILGPNVFCYHYHTNVHPPGAGVSPDVPEPAPTDTEYYRDVHRCFGFHKDTGMGADCETPVQPRFSIKAGYYFSDVPDPSFAPTWVVPGSHHREGSEQLIRPESGQPDGAIPILCKANSAIIFDRRLWHSATPNYSTTTRHATFVGYGYRWLMPKEAMYVEPALMASTCPVRSQLLGGTKSNAELFSPGPSLPVSAWLRSIGVDPETTGLDLVKIAQQAAPVARMIGDIGAATYPRNEQSVPNITAGGPVEVTPLPPSSMADVAISAEDYAEHRLTGSERNTLQDEGFLVLGEGGGLGADSVSELLSLLDASAAAVEGVESEQNQLPIFSQATSGLQEAPLVQSMLVSPTVLPKVCDELGWNIHMSTAFAAYPSGARHSSASSSAAAVTTWGRLDGQLCREVATAGLELPCLGLLAVFSLGTAGEAASVTVLPRSHRVAVGEESSAIAAAQAGDAIRVEIPPGGVVLLDRRIFHAREACGDRGTGLLVDGAPVVCIGWGYRWLRNADPHYVEGAMARVRCPITRQMLSYCTANYARYAPTGDDVPLRVWLHDNGLTDGVGKLVPGLGGTRRPVTGYEEPPKPWGCRGVEFRGGLEGDVGYTTHSRVPWTAAYEKQLHNLSS